LSLRVNLEPALLAALEGFIVIRREGVVALPRHGGRIDTGKSQVNNILRPRIADAGHASAGGNAIEGGCEDDRETDLKGADFGTRVRRRYHHPLGETALDIGETAFEIFLFSHINNWGW
jgi:hypothetical protein